MKPNSCAKIVATFLLCICQQLYAAEKIQIIPDASTTTAHKKFNGKTSSAQTFTFTENDIEDSPVNDITELFRQQQSVVQISPNSGDPTQTALSIRGFGDNAVANTLILVDGFPLTNPSLLAPDFNSIPLADIKRIEIFQGSQGSLWGNQAVGGVVNIITKHPRHAFANTIASVGSYHHYFVNLLTGDKFSNGSFVKVFGLLNKNKNYRDHNDLQGSNIAATAGMNDARGTIVFNLQQYENSTEFPGGLSQQQLDDDPTQATDLQNYSHYRTQLMQLLAKREINTDWVAEARLTQYATKGDGKMLIDFTRRDSTLAFFPRLIGHVYGSKIITGYDGQFSKFNINNVKIDSSTAAWQNDVYAQITVPLASRLAFILGARGAMQSNEITAIGDQAFHSTNKVFVSEQGLKYHPTVNVTLYARRDGNFRFPKANEQTSAARGSTILRTQKGASYETGIEWQEKIFLTKLNLYQLDLDNEIAFNPERTDSHPFGSWSNLDTTRRDGISLAENVEVNDQTKLNGQLNYVNARFASGMYSGKRIPAVPAITGNAGINYDFTESWQIKYYLTYTGTEYASEDMQNAGSKISSYWLHNAAIQYLYKNMMINVEVINLFNQTYVNYAFYNSGSGNNVYYPAAGRNYLLTLKVDMG